MFKRLVGVIFGALWCVSAAQAAPRNDAFAQATPLLGTAGKDIEVNTVGATREPGEPFLPDYQLKQTVWYSYTARRDGVFLVTTDRYNGRKSGVQVEVFGGGAIWSLKALPSTVPVWPLDGPYNGYDTHLTTAVQLRVGQKCYVRFDTGDLMSTGLPGRSAFSYQFSSRGGFAFLDPVSTRTTEDQPARRSSSTRSPRSVSISYGNYDLTKVYTVREGSDREITLTVGRFGSTEGATSVDYKLSESRYLEGSVQGTLNFEPGQTRSSFSFRLLDDEQSGYGGGIGVSLSGAGSGSFILAPEIKLELEEDEGTPANDLFAGAQELTGSGSLIIPKVRATREPGEPAGLKQTLWYRYLPEADGVLQAGAFAFAGASLETLQPLSTSSTPTGFVVAVQKGVPIYLCVPEVTTIYANERKVEYKFRALALVRCGTPDQQVFQDPTTEAEIVIPLERLGSLEKVIDLRYSTPFGSGTVHFELGQINAQIVLQRQKIGKGSKTKRFYVQADSGADYVFVPGPIIQSQESGPVMEACLFAGLLEGGPNDAAPFFSVSVDRAGNLTGKLVLPGMSLPWKAKFAEVVETNGPHLSVEDGGFRRVDVSVARGAVAPLKLRLQLTTTSSEYGKKFSPRLRIKLYEGESEVAQRAAMPFLLAKEAKAQAGKHTLSWTPRAESLSPWKATGFAALQVQGTSTATLIGTLGDGTKFSAGGRLLHVPEVAGVAKPSDTFSFWHDLYVNTGGVSGEITVSSFADSVPPVSGDGGGALRWWRPLVAGEATVAEQWSDVFVSHYYQPPGVLIIGGAAPRTMEVLLKDEEGDSSYSFKVLDGHRVEKPYRGLAPIMSFSLANGLFQGAIPLTDGTFGPVRGVILRNLGYGRGSIKLGSSLAETEAISLIAY